jgi:molybdopterin-containing oxidoreductase family iron-sulfur binding subunit
MRPLQDREDLGRRLVMAYGMVVDLKRCVGCQGCTTSCKEANGTPPKVTRARVDKELTGTYPNVERSIIPMLCMHCENPPCVAVCPAEGATYKREEDGIVVIDKSLCIGCKLCMDACPYTARYYIENAAGYFEVMTDYETKMYANMPAETVDKCDFCIERRSAGYEPACVSTCMAKARFFGTVEELQSLIDSRGGYQLKPEEGTGPQVWYLPAK